MYNNKRCRGKSSFQIAKGTSISKAVSSLLGKKAEMIKTLKEQGTLKSEKIVIKNIDSDDKKLDTLFEIWITNKAINAKPNTTRVYKVNYNKYISKAIGKKDINTIVENDVQKIINEAINNKKAPNTIKGIKRILKPLLEINDVLLNWTRITLPKDTSTRKYTKSKEVTFNIVKELRKFKHKIARGVFEFLLTGRRINETLYLTHENINYKENTFTILAKYAKTKKDFTFNLTSELINAIKSQNTSTGRIFKLEHRQMLLHFKAAMSDIGIYDMVIHDLRSMVAQTALDNGASIYDVSKMLAHQKVSTTEARYIECGAKQAQEVFQKSIELIQDEIIDVEILEDNFLQIKKIYPNVDSEKIREAIKFLEK